MYLKQIEQLVALQRIDNEIVQLKAELDEAPREVEALQAKFDELDRQKQQVLEKLGYLREQGKRLSGEIEDDSLKIKKSKNKLMMVGNTREYHAMTREMDNLEKLNRLREEERVTLAEELERQEASLAEFEEREKALLVELEEKKASLKGRIAEANVKLADLDSQRAKSGEDVPPPVLSRYEFIRSRLAHPVIVPVSEGICSGCNISIPPQGFIELQKGQQILSCPNCQRLIYWCEHFCDPAPARRRPAQMLADDDPSDRFPDRDEMDPERDSMDVDDSMSSDDE
ncbi:MAG: hypothetical protein H0S85_08320 [Desulfovibrionaceae bacterium]|jgi:predicted  nucleic acid-binding Zn-ribbon protein|nr:hypothetical protein [Desulfovibrionaceae bacterium]